MLPFWWRLSFPSGWKYFLMKAHSWVSSQELAPDEGTCLTQDYLPSRGSHIQWLARGGVQRPESLASIWDHSEELPVRSVKTAVTASQFHFSLCPALYLSLPLRCGSQELCPINLRHQISISGSVSQGAQSKTPCSSLSSDFHIPDIYWHFSSAVVSSLWLCEFIPIFVSSTLISMIFLQGIWDKHICSIHCV